MSHQDALSHWIAQVSTALPTLSRCHARLLALISFGMVIARSCGTTSVALALALVLDQSEATLRERIRDGYADAADKRGRRRKAIDVQACFVPLLRWVLTWWSSSEARLALALDATTLGQRFTVLAVSVVYRGCAIPIAWVVLPACTKGAWKPHWEALLTTLAGSVPPTWTVLVLADRGLYARWLYRAITTQGWHPFLRINQQGQVRPAGCAKFYALASVAPAVGSAWSGRVTCFASAQAQLACTLLGRWDAGYTDPWLVVTDLAPEVAEVAWYGMRAWIEGGFKDQKRGGWHWEQTKMTDPARASRLWLAMAIATLWLVSIGGAAETALPASSLDALPATHVARRCRPRGSQPRLLSCFARGMITLVVALIRQAGLPASAFIPEPWPDRRRDLVPSVRRIWWTVPPPQAAA
jgi:hypothetical protein